MPGIATSVTTTSNRSRCSAAVASAPLAAQVTEWPADWSSRA